EARIGKRQIFRIRLAELDRKAFGLRPLAAALEQRADIVGRHHIGEAARRRERRIAVAGRDVEDALVAPEVDGLAKRLADDLQRSADHGIVAGGPGGLLLGLDGGKVRRGGSLDIHVMCPVLVCGGTPQFPNGYRTCGYFPRFASRRRPNGLAVSVGMQEGISRLSNSRHCYPGRETFGAVAKTNQVMMRSSGPLGIAAVTRQDEASSGMSAGAAVLPRAVRRALDFMQAGFERDMGLAELATAAGLSARALQRQFKTFLGKAPHEALRHLRFDAPRPRLP